MSVEMILMAALAQAGDPVIDRAKLTYGYEPADDEDIPTILPLMVMQRDTSEWLTDLCGTRAHPCFVTIALVHIAQGAQECREQAEAARRVLITGPELPTLEAESETYDPDLRAWMVTQMYRVADDNPEVTP
jgi:hypothetical protein